MMKTESIVYNQIQIYITCLSSNPDLSVFFYIFICAVAHNTPHLGETKTIGVGHCTITTVGSDPTINVC